MREEEGWQRAVEEFARGRFGLSIGLLWDWEGTVPLYRVAAASLSTNTYRLGTMYPDGFWLIDDNDSDVLIVDFERDEEAGLVVARVRELELTNA